MEEEAAWVAKGVTTWVTAVVVRADGGASGGEIVGGAQMHAGFQGAVPHAPHSWNGCTI